MTDRIRLAGIEVFAYHGVLEEERRSGQRFVIDVVLELDLSAAGSSDVLEDTVDYGALAVAIETVGSSERWNLIERVAERIADTILERDLVAAVEVTVHKPQAPIAVPFEDVSVSVRRTRR